MRQIDLDLESVIERKFTDEKLRRLVDSLKKYVESRGLDEHSPKDLVSLNLILSAILNLTEQEFLDFVSRLNMVAIRKMARDKKLQSGDENSQILH
jgi:hypothetical protein